VIDRKRIGRNYKDGNIPIKYAKMEALSIMDQRKKVANSILILYILLLYDLNV